MAKATIQKIAEHAGVSRGTVDRVLHNRPNVKPEVREHVIKTAKQLGYPLNAGVETGTMQIAVLLPGNGWFDANLRQEWLRGFWDARLAVEPTGMEVRLVECETDLPNEFITRIAELRENGLDGLALTAKDSPVTEQMIRDLVQDGIKVVTYNSDIPNSCRHCFVGQDDYRSGRVAGSLIARTLSDRDEVLVVAGNLEIDGHKQRVQGFCDKCRECGVASYQISIVESFNEYLLTYEKVGEALQSKPNLKAIYMANESVAACAEALSRSKRTEKILVVGNDLTTETKRLLREDVVDFIIKQDVYWQGYQPVILLKNLLLSPDTPLEAVVFTGISVINSENMD